MKDGSHSTPEACPEASSTAILRNGGLYEDRECG